MLWDHENPRERWTRAIKYRVINAILKEMEHLVNEAVRNSSPQWTREEPNSSELFVVVKLNGSVYHDVGGGPAFSLHRCIHIPLFDYHQLLKDIFREVPM